MKTPFRLQVSEFDCVPTTFLNAISFLFNRKDIHPLVIQKIYLYSLDKITSRKNIGHGTTGFAIQILCNWLSEFKTNDFSLFSEFISGGEVCFGRGNKISKCLNDGGVALLRIHWGNKSWHYVLALKIEDGWVNVFDPYPKREGVFIKDRVEFISQNGIQSANLKISISHLETRSNSAKYVLGTFSERECVLLRKK